MNYKLFLYLLFFIFLTANNANAQPSASFISPDSTCIGSEITLSNTTINATSYQWDFCLDDLSVDPVFESSDTITGGNLPIDTDIIFEQGVWYGFSCDFLNNKLYRLDFGNSLGNTPSHTDLGNPGNLLSQPYQTKFLQVNDTWYAFAVNFANSRLLRFTFGNGVNMAPTSTTNLGNFGLLNKPMGLFINEEGGNYIVTVSNNSGNNLTLINFGNSPANNPTSGDAISIGSDIGLSGSGRFSIIKTPTGWHGLVCSVNNGKVYKLDFESILFDSNYSFTEIASVSTPNGVELVREGLNYVGYVVSNTSGFYRLSFGQSLSNSPTIDAVGKTGIPDQFRSLKIARQSPGWFGFINSRYGSLLSKVSFSDNCTGSLTASNAFEPNGVSYDSAGTFAIELTAFSANGNFDTNMDTVVVKDVTAPTISFAIENACISNPNTFSASSSDDASITAWNWDFGDGTGTATGQNVSYQFLDTGNFEVKLDITTIGGCSNTISDFIQIALPPIAAFDLPVSNLCTNTTLNFTNTSNVLAEDSAIFIWNYNNEALDTITHGNYIFDSNGTKDISLYVNLTGCQDTLTQQITLSPGPFIDFSWSNNCFGDSLQMINTSEVANTTFSWDFGDESPGSPLFEPKHLYSAAGSYAISLSVSDTFVGCVSIKTDSIYVNDQLLVNFSYDSSITENIQTQFFGQDLTMKGDTVEQWNWDFGVYGSSMVMNPIISFPQSDSINVRLSVVTEQGCEDQHTDTIVVQEADRPLTSFSMQDSTCISSEITLSNTTINGTSYQWDFCMDDLSVAPVFESSDTITGGSLPIDTDIIFEQGVWYGFSCDFLNNKLYRLVFGNSLENTPSHTDLGNPGNLLSQPYQTKFLKFNDTWYAFAVNFANSKLLRLTFGDGVNMAPTSTTDLGNFGLLNKPMGLFINEEGGNYIVTVSNNSGNNLTLINFGNSPANNPTSGDAISIGSDIGLSGSGRFSIIRTPTNWYGLVCSVNNGKVYKLDFENILFDSNYSFTEVALVSTPNGVELVREGLNYVGYVVSNTGGFYRLSFEQNLSHSPTVETIGKIGIPDEFRSLKIVRQSPGWFGFINSRNGSLLSKVSFSDYCSGSLASSNAFEPYGVSYDNAGSFTIELTAFSANGNFDTYMDTVVVRDATSPAISFSSNGNACISNPNTFSATSSDDASIISWNWDFGDGTGTASGQNVQYQFLDSGNYQVKLSIDAINGCSNTYRQLVSIYNPPQASFDYQSGILCSNSSLEFYNNSIFYGPDSVIRYQWNFNDEASFITADTSFTFTSGGDKNVTLSASIPGCFNETSQIISITPGPLTNFNFIGNCVYDTYNFSNNTLGDDITGYNWDFGDGYTSTNISPMHQYISGGTYAVSLTASNVLGCNTTLQQVVPVHFTPTPNFTNDLACAENSVIFYDQSSVTNANITDQYWTLTNDDLDYAESATGATPSFLLGNAGNYEMTLIATSNYGCSDTLVRNDITIQPSPKADFAIENLCFGDSTKFYEKVELPTDLNLNSIEWIIDGNLYSENEVKVKFHSPGEYNVELYARADNFCIDNTSQTISILPLPEIEIDLSAYCADQPVTINSSINSSDPVIAYNWQINDKPVSNLESFIYDFDKVGLYNIGLGVTTENYCYNYQSQEITINPSPVSEFELFPSIGANPLNVVFTDLSQGASEVLYDFSENNSDTSDEFNPEYTYITLGKDWPKQIAENEFGCTDTSYSKIEVVIPIYDIALSNARFEVIDQKLKMVVEVQNNGTIIINNPEIKIDIDKKLALTQILEGRLWPGDQQSFEIDFDVILNNQSLNYICFALNKELGNYKDANPYDNSECLSIEAAFNVLEPYPNPARDFVFVPIILSSPGACEILMTNEKGTTLFQNQYKNLKEGLNLFKIELSIYNQGLYMLVIKHEQFENTKKIVIN